MILRLDDTDVERNTEASVQSIFEGLKWLDLSWDEEYKQSERGELHRQMAETIFQKGLAYRRPHLFRNDVGERELLDGSALTTFQPQDLQGVRSG